MITRQLRRRCWQHARNESIELAESSHRDFRTEPFKEALEVRKVTGLNVCSGAGEDFMGHCQRWAFPRPIFSHLRPLERVSEHNFVAVGNHKHSDAYHEL